MRTPFTIQNILNSKVADLNQHLVKDGSGKKKRARKLSKEKTWISFKLNEFAKERNLTLSREYMFHGERNWRFDWCFVSLKVAFEYEGIISAKSRHTTIAGFTGDVEKYNAAATLGWKVYRYTAINYLDLTLELMKYDN